MSEETPKRPVLWPALIGVTLTIVLQLVFGIQAYSALAQRVADLDNEVRRIEQFIDRSTALNK